jgi:hypothetical protein
VRERKSRSKKKGSFEPSSYFLAAFLAAFLGAAFFATFFAMVFFIKLFMTRSKKNYQHKNKKRNLFY